MTTDADWAWAAGIFEGEGSFATSRSGAFRMQVKMTDHDVLLRLQGIVGGTVYGPYAYQQPDGHTRKPAWVWNTDGTDAAAIARRFAPWLGQRRLARLLTLGVLDQLPLFTDPL